MYGFLKRWRDLLGASDPDYIAASISISRQLTTTAAGENKLTRFRDRVYTAEKIFGQCSLPAHGHLFHGIFFGKQISFEIAPGVIAIDEQCLKANLLQGD